MIDGRVVVYKRETGDEQIGEEEKSAVPVDVRVPSYNNAAPLEFSAV